MFSNFLTDAAVVAVVLGVMIFVHELGHFTAAKWFGVRVLTFSLGFGKRLFGFKIGDTDYRVSLLPLGGYVKMAGEEPSDSVISGSENPESSGAASATPDDDPGKFLSKPRDRKSTRLNSSHITISYAVFCLKKKKKIKN